MNDRARKLSALGAMTIAAAGARLFGAERTLDLVRNTNATGFDKRQRAHLFNQARADHNRGVEAMKRVQDPRSLLTSAINSLSGYERKVWVKAGKPGWIDVDPAKVLAFRGVRKAGA